MHFTMDKIKDVSDGLSFLIEGETGEAPSFTEINEVRTSHGRATVSQSAATPSQILLT